MSECPWCNELDCDHCRCTGYDYCLHTKDSQCLKPRYKRRRVCNPCGGSRDRQRVHNIRYSKRNIHSKMHTSVGFDSKDADDYLNRFMREKVEVVDHESSISDRKKLMGEINTATDTTSSNAYQFNAGLHVEKNNSMIASVPLGFRIQYPGVGMHMMPSVPNMVMLDQNRLMAVMLVKNEKPRQPSLSHGAIPGIQSSPSPSGTICSNMCRYCHHEIEFSKALDLDHVELLRNKHETRCAVLYYEKSRASNRANSFEI